MKKAVSILKRNNGDSTFISSLLAIFWLLAVVVFFVLAAGVFKVNSDLSNAADKLMRSAELSGHTVLQAQADLLREQTGLDFALSWDGTEYIAGTNKVQLNSDIYLHLWTPYRFKMGDFPLFEVTVNVRRTGTGELYYK